jgi:hypothetical protein
MDRRSSTLLLFATSLFLTVLSYASETIDIPLNSPVVLNGSSKEYILKLRRQYIDKIPALAPKNYKPSMDVFGQIQDGKPWWGMMGMCYYGPGEKSILGVSKESRFIVNPYLLVGAEEVNAHIIPVKDAVDKEFYPSPIRLSWQKNGSQAQVTYNVEEFYRQAVKYRYPDTNDLYLSDYNARDFGFNYLAVDSSGSENITAAFDKIININQFIHTGGSCGYPGGCNNKSPHQDELVIKWSKLPAKISIRLWKAQPANARQKADMEYIIDLASSLNDTVGAD